MRIIIRFLILYFGPYNYLDVPAIDSKENKNLIAE